MQNLRTLSLASNNLEKIPVNVWELTQLEHLDLSDNKISKLDEEIANLVNLKSLDLRGNEIDVHAKTHILSLVPKTSIIHLGNNPCGE